MTYRIVDQRNASGGRNLPNRQRFMKRQQAFIKEAVRNRVRASSIKDVGTGKDKKIKISGKALHEPSFGYGEGGIVEDVRPGNKKFKPGQKIPRPPYCTGKSRGSPDGEDERELVISEQEFLDILFEGCELPDMIKRFLLGEEEVEYKRAGVSNDGPASRLDIKRTIERSHARRRAFLGSREEEMAALEKERTEIEAAFAVLESPADIEPFKKWLRSIDVEIALLEKRMGKVPFIESLDLRYRRSDEEPSPITKAVMFCIRDVSGSMDEWKTEMSHIFLSLLYRFLVRSYKHVEVRFIIYHTIAKEVPEQEFFETTESGGTNSSSALAIMVDVIRKDYPLSEWNVYGAMCSDGDIAMTDLEETWMLMNDQIIPVVQYFAYVEIDKIEVAESTLWNMFEQLEKLSKNVARAHINDQAGIYAVFRKLFERKDVSNV